jgi:hypothetical protein
VHHTDQQQRLDAVDRWWRLAAQAQLGLRVAQGAIGRFD